MKNKSKTVLILHADTPSGKAAKKASDSRGYTVIEIKHVALQKKSSSIYELDTSNAIAVDQLDRKLIARDITVNYLITCPATVPIRLKDTFYDEFQKMSDSTWNDIIEQNLHAAMLFCKVFSRQMLKRNNGSIIQLVSNVAIDPHDPRHLTKVRRDGTPGHPSAAYTCAMAGVQSLSRHLAADFGKTGVLINNIVYGPLKEAEPPALLTAYLDRVPSGRFMTIADLANAIDLLLNPYSNYITGQNIIVDGGVTIW